MGRWAGVVLWTAASVAVPIAGVPATGGMGRGAPTTSQAIAKPITLDLGNGVTLELVPIPAGKFLMGSPAAEPGRRDDETQHEVTISRPFYLGETLVTQAQYEAVTGRNPSRVNRGPKYPVDSVSWLDAAAFCQKVSAKIGRRVSRPTVAQWEYACRAGTTTRFFSGDDETVLRKYALFWARTDLPVAQFKPNPWGLYDMLGSLHEWCADWYAPYEDKAVTDPTGPATGEAQVLRGGCFHNSAKFCRSASRVMYPPAQADYDFGFRVLTEGPATATRPK